MKKWLLIVCFQLVQQWVGAQVNPNPISILRYNDDFGFLQKDSIKRGLHKLKYIPVHRTIQVSFGGEIREQYQYFRHLNFGDVPPASKNSAGQLWHRIMLHSNIDWGNKIRLFVQLNSTFRFFNSNPITEEIDENRLSLHQLFVDYRPGKKWMVRAGRQELGYGNNRLLTFREGPNTRLTFNAVIVKYTTDKRKIDLLALTPVVSRQYVFDDVSFKDFVGGIYGTETVLPKKLLLDYYFLHFSSTGRRYNYVPGKERRQTTGLRLFSQNSRLNYELEATWQTGRFKELHIAAYGFSADVYFKLVPQKNLVAGISSNYFTGDKNTADDQLNTYNLLFSKPSYGLAAPIGSSNIININPYIKFNPVKKWSLYAGIYFMQRQSNQDGTYSPGMAQLRPLPSALFTVAQNSIGTQYALESGYDVNGHFFVAFDAAYFKAGDYVTATGRGLNITYLAAKASFKF